MFKSIFERLFWTNVAILMLVFMSVSVSLTIFMNNYITDRQYETVVKASQTLEYWTGILQVENNNIQARNSYRQTLTSWADFVNADIILTNQSGEVIESTDSSITTAPKEYVNTVVANQTLKKRGTFGNAYDNKVFTVGIPISYNGTIIGAMFFNTKLPQLNKMVMELIYMFMISSLFSILMAFLFVYLQSRSISNPIKAINNVAMDIASGKFEKRVTVTSTDEIGQLASSFNFMADSLERLEQMRDSFVSDVSHELRTPMTSISGFIQGILDHTIPPEKEREYLQIVLDESQRLAKLVNDLLDMSKMSGNEYKLDISKFDINEIIRLCIIGLEQKISGRNLELDVDFSKDNLFVFADKDAIRRVIINLMDNAVKFSYPNTTIGIKTWIEDKKAHICIGNFGDGIDGKDLQNIFDRFYKTDKSRTGDKSGAGLGLSFVKNILVLHKQSIWVESVDTKEGSNAKYTKFTFTLELA